MICEGRQMLPRLGGDTLLFHSWLIQRCRERERERTSALETYARSIERKECSQTLLCKVFHVPFCPRLSSPLPSAEYSGQIIIYSQQKNVYTSVWRKLL